MHLVLIQSDNIMTNYIILKTLIHTGYDLEEVTILYDKRCNICKTCTKKLIKIFSNDINIKDVKIDNFYNYEEIRKNMQNIPQGVDLYCSITNGYKITALFLKDIIKKEFVDSKWLYLDIHSNIISIRNSKGDLSEEVIDIEKLDFNIKLKKLLKDTKIVGKSHYSWKELRVTLKKNQYVFEKIYNTLCKSSIKPIYNLINEFHQAKVKGFFKSNWGKVKINKKAKIIEIFKKNYLYSEFYKEIEADSKKFESILLFITDELLEFLIFYKLNNILKEISTNNDNVLTNISLYKEVQADSSRKPIFEIDAILKIGFKIFVISITKGSNLKGNEYFRDHLFEVIFRSKQVGGYAAIPVIVSSKSDKSFIKDMVKNNNGFQEQVYPISIENFEKEFINLVNDIRRA